MRHARIALLAAAGVAAAGGSGVALASGGAPPPPQPDPPPYTIVASGTGTADVGKPYAQTDASIERVVRDARAKAMPAAVANARREAAALGSASGLVPGAVVAVRRDTSPPGWWSADDGVFGPGRWCGRIYGGRRTVRNRDGSTRRVNRYRDGCKPPRTVALRLSVTFAASPR
jgi:hypothetical protein